MRVLLQTQRLYGFVFCLGLALLFGMMVSILLCKFMTWHRQACRAICMRPPIADAALCTSLSHVIAECICRPHFSSSPPRGLLCCIRFPTS